MLLAKKRLWLLLPAFVLFLFSCEKEKKEFSFEHDWKVESVSRAGTSIPRDVAVGDNYYFKSDGKCYLTRHATGALETHTWGTSNDAKVLYIDDFRYEIYKAEGNELVFGQVIDGKEVVTYHTRKR